MHCHAWRCLVHSNLQHKLAPPHLVESSPRAAEYLAPTIHKQLKTGRRRHHETQCGAIMGGERIFSDASCCLCDIVTNSIYVMATYLHTHASTRTECPLIFQPLQEARVHQRKPRRLAIERTVRGIMVQHEGETQHIVHVMRRKGHRAEVKLE